MSFIPINPEDIPEQVRALLDSKDMVNEGISVMADEYRHTLYNLFEVLDAEQLRAIRILFNNITHTDESVIASYWVGWIAALEQAKFDLCPACGEVHPKGHTGLDVAMKEVAGEQP